MSERACFDCGGEADHEHHVVPRSRGGTRTVSLCGPCHGLVHDAALSSTSSLTRDALAKKKLRGERAGALPIGSALAGDGVRLVEHPEERAAVGRMTELRASGRSLRDIAEMLTEEGYPARGSRWHRTTVERVLRRALP